MKLIDPTDDELNAAFAEKVAGWTRFFSENLGAALFHPPGLPDAANVNKRFEVPRFTQSADTVLPWLEKWRDGNTLFIAGTSIFGERAWGVDLIDNSQNFRQFVKDPSLPRAAVIALLRAHGVEVEFTKA